MKTILLFSLFVLCCMAAGPSVTLKTYELSFKSTVSTTSDANLFFGQTTSNGTYMLKVFTINPDTNVLVDSRSNSWGTQTMSLDKNWLAASTNNTVDLYLLTVSNWVKIEGGALTVNGRVRSIKFNPDASRLVIVTASAVNHYTRDKEGKVFQFLFNYTVVSAPLFDTGLDHFVSPDGSYSTVDYVKKNATVTYRQYKFDGLSINSDGSLVFAGYSLFNINTQKVISLRRPTTDYKINNIGSVFSADGNYLFVSGYSDRDDGSTGGLLARYSLKDIDGEHVPYDVATTATFFSTVLLTDTTGSRLIADVDETLLAVITYEKKTPFATGTLCHVDDDCVDKMCGTGHLCYVNGTRAVARSYKPLVEADLDQVSVFSQYVISSLGTTCEEAGSLSIGTLFKVPQPERGDNPNAYLFDDYNNTLLQVAASKDGKPLGPFQNVSYLNSDPEQKNPFNPYRMNLTTEDFSEVVWKVTVICQDSRANSLPVENVLDVTLLRPKIASSSSSTSKPPPSTTGRGHVLAASVLLLVSALLCLV